MYVIYQLPDSKLAVLTVCIIGDTREDQVLAPRMSSIS
jgi:hypothetical protein